MPVDKTLLKRSSQSSPTHLLASQTLAPLSRIVGAPISAGSGRTVRGTSPDRIRRFMLIRLPPPLYLIRFR